ncbi:MAG: sugar phosphate isomerase/epimerase [Ruminococcaceae bacterium]|nr:sugar phosphate isomerase/epimerase [Oscillospiraceae bacterium]
MKIEKLGLQLYTIRDFMKTPEQIRESFKKIKALGYDVAQTAGCQIPFEEFGQIAHEEGIEICGTHEAISFMIDKTEEAIAAHKALGTTNMGVGGFNGAKTIADAEGYVERVNNLANKIYDRGFKFTYHNHSFEFQKYDNGKSFFDILVEGLDPVKTSFCLDTYWVQHAGGDVRYLLERLNGRIDILHLKAMAVNGNDPFITELGNDNMNWEGILETADKIGVKYYVVEQDSCPGDPFESIRKSSEYLHKYFM